MSEAMPSLQSLREDWERALVVVPHPDDMEYGGAAAIARWTGQGKHVAYCLLTSGEAGIDGLSPAEAGPLRETEQRNACLAVGVEVVEFLGMPDGMLEYGLDMRRAITASIRRHRPEILIIVNFRETYGGVMLNQADHIAGGRAALDAARDAGNRWVFTDLVTEGLEPWSGVKEVWVAGSPNATHAVDVTDSFEAGLASLREHKAYLDGLGPDSPDPAEFLEGFARQTGQGLGCALAVSMEVLPLQLL
ncbi:MAG TPA: PIG-L deacetylase family protein [Actinomycetes bacterium]|nr:PIG-L deacetylase family protein [Actinomycetes bacterium]